MKEEEIQSILLVHRIDYEREDYLGIKEAAKAIIEAHNEELKRLCMFTMLELVGDRIQKKGDFFDTLGQHEGLLERFKASKDGK